MIVDNQEILKEAIEKAMKGGYYSKFSERYVLSECMMYHRYYAIIFDHNFAKTFWGNERIECAKCGSRRLVVVFGGNNPHCCKKCGEYMQGKKYKGWKYHLQTMVLKKEPLKYIEKFIKED